MGMETMDLTNDKNEELPFSFKKDNILPEKIKEHWQKIVDKIAEKDGSVEPDTKK